MKSKLIMILGLLIILFGLGSCQLDSGIDQITDETPVRGWVPTQNGFTSDWIWWGIADRYSIHNFYFYLKITDLPLGPLAFYSSDHFEILDYYRETNYNVNGFTRFRIKAQITFNPDENPPLYDRKGYLFGARYNTMLDYLIVYIC